LCQRDVDIAYCIHRSEHGNPRRQLESGDRVIPSIRLPLAPAPIGHAQPGLIQVQQYLLAGVLLKQFDGPLLPQHQAPLAVRSHGYVVDLLVAHAFVSHDLPYLCFSKILNDGLTGFSCLGSYNLLMHHLAGVDKLVRLDHVIDDSLDAAIF
jgi:hypothetical protein